MDRSNKQILILFLLFAFMSVSLCGQNYREQMKLIRLKPNKLMVFGQIETPSEELVTDANISLFDPALAKIVETIPVDDLGEYFFTLEKGKSFGLIIEKEGLFPYYTQFVVPIDIEKEWDNPIKLPEGLVNIFTLEYDFAEESPSNTEELDALIKALTDFADLSVWVQEDTEPIFQKRMDKLRSILGESEIESYRLLIGDPPSDPDRYIRIRIISSNIPPAGDINEPESEVQEDEEPVISPDKWTLQFIASKSEITGNGLKGVENFKLFKGKDGYFRYTYGVYDSKEDTGKGKNYLNSKGFKQAFAKKIADLQKL